MVAIVAGVGLLVLLAAGLVVGGGDFGRLFGTDWSQVNWSDVATMMLIVLAIAVVLVPLTWWLLPRRMKGVGAAFMALAILAPLGLIAPGFAYGEGSPQDVKAAFGYVPKGLQNLSVVSSSLKKEYDIPFVRGENEALWQTAIGYELSGIIGIIVLGATVWGLASLLRRRTVRPVTAKEASGP